MGYAHPALWNFCHARVPNAYAGPAPAALPHLQTGPAFSRKPRLVLAHKLPLARRSKTSQPERAERQPSSTWASFLRLPALVDLARGSDATLPLRDPARPTPTRRRRPHVLQPKHARSACAISPHPETCAGMHIAPRVCCLPRCQCPELAVPHVPCGVAAPKALRCSPALAAHMTSRRRSPPRITTPPRINTTKRLHPAPPPHILPFCCPRLSLADSTNAASDAACGKSCRTLHSHSLATIFICRPARERSAASILQQHVWLVCKGELVQDTTAPTAGLLGIRMYKVSSAGDAGRRGLGRACMWTDAPPTSPIDMPGGRWWGTFNLRLACCRRTYTARCQSPRFAAATLSCVPNRKPVASSPGIRIIAPSRGQATSFEPCPRPQPNMQVSMMHPCSTASPRFSTMRTPRCRLRHLALRFYGLGLGQQSTCAYGSCIWGPGVRATLVVSDVVSMHDRQHLLHDGPLSMCIFFFFFSLHCLCHSLLFVL